MRCRHCNADLKFSFVDIGNAPPSNAYLEETCLKTEEKYYPLKVLVCTRCWLVQTQDFADSEELFNDQYAYFSSFSTSWLAHAESYVRDIVKRFKLNYSSHVVEVAANDGYLLQFFKERHIPCTGVEPTASTSGAARKKGLTIIEAFFGSVLAQKLVAQGAKADLMVANNVLAHVPDINDFVSGFVALLKHDGVATFEVPHLFQLVKNGQFDTIYHEHFSYFSFNCISRIFQANGLSIFDVQKLHTHGGSLRVFAQRSDTGTRSTSLDVPALLDFEKRSGMEKLKYYLNFQVHIDNIKKDFLAFLVQARRDGKKVGAYGAAAKASTLINFAGVGTDLIPFIADKNPVKQGKYMPGSRIPIVPESVMEEMRPDYVIVFPWNIQDEIMGQLFYVREWGGQFVTCVPGLKVHP